VIFLISGVLIASPGGSVDVADKLAQFTFSFREVLPETAVK